MPSCEKFFIAVCSPMDTPRPIAVCRMPATPEAMREMPNSPPTPSTPVTSSTIPAQRMSESVASLMLPATPLVVLAILVHSRSLCVSVVSCLRLSSSTPRRAAFCAISCAVIFWNWLEMATVDEPVFCHICACLPKAVWYLSKYSEKRLKSASLIEMSIIDLTDIEILYFSFFPPCASRFTLSLTNCGIGSMRSIKRNGHFF